MTLWQKIKMLRWLNKTADEATEVNVETNKPGWKTTEFWVTTLTSLWSMFGGMVPSPWNVIVPTIMGAVYTAARTYSKSKETTQTTVNVKSSDVTVEASKPVEATKPQ